MYINFNRISIRTFYTIERIEKTFTGKLLVRSKINMNLSNENILHIKKDDIEYLQCKKLLEFDNLVHCYTLSVNNVDFRTNYSKESILNSSYDRICNALEIKRMDIVKPKQTHTDCIRNVENRLEIYSNPEKYNDVDGLLTNKNNINLMLSFADCTPILLYDPINKVIGNIHSGWRGTAQKIGQKAVQKMIKEYNSNPEEIIACIGPCIGKCHFEVDEDVKNIFEKTFSYMERNCDIIEKQEDLVDGKQKYHIDTTIINRLILEECGLRKNNIIESNICTVCNSKYMHSHRARGQEAGRNVTILGMKQSN